jgi:transposase-like protein
MASHGGGSPKGDRNQALPPAAQNRKTNLSSSNSSAATNPSPEQKRRYLSAEKEFQIYLQAQDGGKPVGELLRHEGLFSRDLARIRQQVKEGALQRLSAKPGPKQSQVSTEAYEAIQFELQNQERGLADLSVELAILRKKTHGGSWDR